MTHPQILGFFFFTSSLMMTKAASEHDQQNLRSVEYKPKCSTESTPCEPPNLRVTAWPLPPPLSPHPAAPLHHWRNRLKKHENAQKWMAVYNAGRSVYLFVGCGGFRCCCSHITAWSDL